MNLMAQILWKVFVVYSCMTYYFEAIQYPSYNFVRYKHTFLPKDLKTNEEI